MKKNKYNLLLIKPKQSLNHYSTQIQIARLMGKKTNSIPLALTLIAALTPEHYNIKIVDEDIEPLPKRFHPDIVGITMLNSNSERGLEIGDFYKHMGAKVVMGGTYPSFHHDECKPHTDSIVVGEAELHWKNVLQDFENNTLKPIYQNNEFADFSTSVMPRWDLTNHRKFLSFNVQATRGCPYQCEFCIATKMFGRKVRKRNIDNVINEIQQLPKKNILFVDENLTIDKKYAKELCRALKPLKRNWMCQSSVDIAEDEELLKEMADAGCNYIIIGFESIKKESLASAHKFQNNPEHYYKIIDRIHQHGIHVYASFIIGFDEDTIDDLHEFERFIDNSALPVFTLSILGTAKGMDMYQRLEKEGRIIPGLSKKYFVGTYPVIFYKNFSNTDLFHQFNQTTNTLYSYERIRKRTIKMLEKGYFARPKTTQSISFWLKLRTTIILLCTHLFTKNKAKRLFFQDIISLIKKRKLAISEAAAVLLMFEAITRHLKKDEKNRNAFLAELEAIEEKKPKT